MSTIDPVARNRHADPLIDLAQWLRATEAHLPAAVIGSTGLRSTGLAAARSVDLPTTAEEAIALGNALAEEGVGLLVLASDEQPIVDRALIALLTSKDAARVAPRYRPDAKHVREWQEQVESIAHTSWAHRNLLSTMDRIAEQIGSPRVHAMSHLILTAAERRTPMLISGVAAAAGALIAQRLDRRSVGWLALTSRTGDLAVESAQERLALPSVFAAKLTDEIKTSEIALAIAQVSALLAL